MASVWTGVVRRMYHIDHWELAEGWNTYAIHDMHRVDGLQANIRQKGSSLSTSTSLYWQMQKEEFRVQGT